MFVRILYTSMRLVLQPSLVPETKVVIVQRCMNKGFLYLVLYQVFMNKPEIRALINTCNGV